MIERGELVPHFQVRTINGEEVRYSTIWQHHPLVLITLPERDAGAASRYVGAFAAHADTFRDERTVCVITHDRMDALPAPGVLVADQWGEVVHAATAPDVEHLPSAEDVVDWVRFARMRCPECEGEWK